MKSFKDEESRRLIVTDFDNTLFVEAGAGSGKTTSMVARLMAIILNGLAQVQEIVAITFTNEGAASLKLKIQHELERANRTSKYELSGGIVISIGEKEKEFLSNAIRFLPLAQFSTIHSFCLSILKERPIEAGIDPDFNMESESDISSSFDEYWNRFLIEQSASSGLLSKIIEENIDLESLKKIASIKCSNPNLELYSESVNDISEKLIDLAFKQIADILKNADDNIKSLIADTGTDTGNSRSEECRRFLASFQKTSDYKSKKVFITSTSAPNLKMVKKYSDAIDAFVQIKQILINNKKIIDDYKHRVLISIISQFQKYYTESKKNHSKLDFDDLLFLTAQLLQNNLEVRKYFKKKYKFIFVDETQDTDPLQTESMFFLAEKYDKNASGWHEVELHPSKLFMVGDPKQSIYKFRKADVQIYEKTKLIISSQGGKILELTRNFRSHKNIIDFVNTHFGTSFKNYTQDQLKGLQANYIPLDFSARHSANFNKNIFTITVPDGNVSVKIPGEINKIISLINMVVNNSNYKIYDEETLGYRNIRYSDVMILFKGLTHIDTYTAEFERYNIPHQVVGGKTFFNTEDIKGLVYALKAIDDPLDNLSLYTALRSPIFGLSDKSLFNFVNSGKRLSLFADTSDDVSDVALIIIELKQLLYLKNKNRPSVIIKKIFDLSGICHLVLNESNGHQKSSRYYRFLEMLLEIESDQTLSFSGVIEKLEDRMNSDDPPSMSNLSLSQSGWEAVKLITIHKSKGLESPVIILAGCQFGVSESEPDYFLLRDEGKIVIPYGGGGIYSLDRDELLQIEVRKAACEDERLRYVASTRAKDILAICTTLKGEFNGAFSSTLSESENTEEVPFLAFEERANVIPKEKIDVEKLYNNALIERTNLMESLGKNASSINSPFHSVHDIMEYDESVFADENRIKRGKAFGNLVHRMMEYYINGNLENPESVIDSWMEEEDVRKNLRKSLLAMFEYFKKNEYVIEAKASKEKYCEWEFFCKDNDKIVNGKLDVVYKNAEGSWIILDFKTDDVSDPVYKSKVDAIYTQQMEVYKKYFELLTNERVVELKVVYAQ